MEDTCSMVIDNRMLLLLSKINFLNILKNNFTKSDKLVEY
ncbi:hypothetical protein bcere0021_33160 [Bacillus cereus Rock3-42]|nr:hypothetical protein bcere0021_33160 [Bacillus cereus Rock3-42]